MKREKRRMSERERGRELFSMGSTLIQIDGSLPPQTMEQLLLSRERERDLRKKSNKKLVGKQKVTN